jgi:hypothetical protein
MHFWANIHSYPQRDGPPQGSSTNREPHARKIPQPCFFPSIYVNNLGWALAGLPPQVMNLRGYSTTLRHIVTSDYHLSASPWSTLIREFCTKVSPRKTKHRTAKFTGSWCHQSYEEKYHPEWKIISINRKVKLKSTKTLHNFVEDSEVRRIRLQA